ncbi:hypothetical protein A3734_06445 [Sulfitobacter sp. HI0054]|uniref:SLOG family protein n=1 Tax=Sulfitobacter sp. HI0054 TaxID=1822238 RepID=UPI0007C3B526|nr:SLOG family protein [Sulfitobacter sp. HI0054]KZY50995.1 hypothetical protein A3734_06445 [Sulfitobacter sp. HI0054]
MRILVCGSRHCDEELSDLVWNRLQDIIPGNEPCTIIHGAAPGVDTQAMIVADMLPNCKHLPFEAEWNKHGRAAGPIRNKRMLDEGKPDLVVAFPGGRGTANMVKQAKAGGFKVIEVTP